MRRSLRRARASNGERLDRQFAVSAERRGLAENAKHGLLRMRTKTEPTRYGGGASEVEGLCQEAHKIGHEVKGLESESERVQRKGRNHQSKSPSRNKVSSIYLHR